MSQIDADDRAASVFTCRQALLCESEKEAQTPTALWQRSLRACLAGTPLAYKLISIPPKVALARNLGLLADARFGAF